MKKILLITAVSISFLSGCASVPMELEANSKLAKEFNSPGIDKAAVYIYREDTHFGAALKKSVWIDRECIGATAKGVFFYHEVIGDTEHTISTESEFSPNDLVISMKSGRMYFFKQYLKMGLFVGGAGLEQKDVETGKKEIAELKLATKGNCDK